MKAEIDNFLRNCVNSGFRFEDIIKEATNKMIKHVGREAIQGKQLPNNFNLRVKTGTDVKNSVQQYARN